MTNKGYVLHTGLSKVELREVDAPEGSFITRYEIVRSGDTYILGGLENSKTYSSIEIARTSAEDLILESRGLDRESPLLKISNGVPPSLSRVDSSKKGPNTLDFFLNYGSYCRED